MLWLCPSVFSDNLYMWNWNVEFKVGFSLISIIHLPHKGHGEFFLVSKGWMLINSINVLNNFGNFGSWDIFFFSLGLSGVKKKLNLTHTLTDVEMKVYLFQIGHEKSFYIFNFKILASVNFFSFLSNYPIIVLCLREKHEK